MAPGKNWPEKTAEDLGVPTALGHPALPTPGAPQAPMPTGRPPQCPVLWVRNVLTCPCPLQTHSCPQELIFTLIHCSCPGWLQSSDSPLGSLCSADVLRAHSRCQRVSCSLAQLPAGLGGALCLGFSSPPPPLSIFCSSCLTQHVPSSSARAGSLLPTLLAGRASEARWAAAAAAGMVAGHSLGTGTATGTVLPKGTWQTGCGKASKEMSGPSWPPGYFYCPRC